MAIGWHGYSAGGSNRVCTARYDGRLYRDISISKSYGIRPVVSIPRSDIIKTLLGI